MKNGEKIHKLISAGKILLIPIIFAIFLVLWFYFIQDNILAYNLSSQFNNTTKIILDSLIRTFTHQNLTHLNSNIMMFLLFSFIIITLYKSKYYILILILSIICSMLVISIRYSSGVGFSIVTSCLYSISIIAFIYSCYNWYRKSIHKHYQNTIIIYTLALVFASRQLILDISLLTGIYTKDNLGYLEYIIDEIPQNYTAISSEAHIFGFIFGCIIGLNLILYINIMNIHITRI